MNGVLTLYRAPFSTNVERVALALAHKGLSVRSVIIDYADRSEVQRVGGQPLVPALVDGEAVVWDPRASSSTWRSDIPGPRCFRPSPRGAPR